MKEIINIDANKFKEIVLDSKIPVLVDFWAPWCQPCLMMSPVLDELAKKMEGRMLVIKINVNNLQNQSLAIEQEIRSIPNMKLFRDGKIINEFVGMINIDDLINQIESSIK